MQIQYHGKVTVADVRKAIFLNYSPLYIGLTVVLSLVTLGVFLYILVLNPTGESPSFIWLFLLGLLSMPLWQPFLTARSAERKGSLYANLLRGEVDEGGFSVDTGERRAESAWDSFTHHKKTESMVLLYKGKYCVNIFTPRLFAGQQEWERFVGLVGGKLPERMPRKPVQVEKNA
ncbi:MAG: hypothetical protein JXB85_11520 [Anaerolineales bacterium]|nr:hypothetical protein [Anaerolineales bacterium]